MLHTKVHGNRSTGSKDDLKAFYNIWAWEPSGHVTNIILIHFHFLIPKRLHTKFCQKRSSGFLEKQVLILITLILNTHIILSTHPVICIL